jgi:hypothetical protein
LICLISGCGRADSDGSHGELQFCSISETNILSVCLENTGIGALHIAGQAVAVRAARCLFDFHLRTEIRRQKVSTGRIDAKDGRLYRDGLPAFWLRLIKGKDHGGDTVIYCSLYLIDVTGQQGVALKFRAAR